MVVDRRVERQVASELDLAGEEREWIADELRTGCSSRRSSTRSSMRRCDG
jgi:hypothetical protein